MACHRCHGPVLPRTEKAFKMIAGRGEMYCPACYDFLFPDQAQARREREAKQAKKSKETARNDSGAGQERRWF